MRVFRVVYVTPEMNIFSQKIPPQKGFEPTSWVSSIRNSDSQIQDLDLDQDRSRILILFLSLRDTFVISSCVSKEPNTSRKIRFFLNHQSIFNMY